MHNKTSVSFLLASTFVTVLAGGLTGCNSSDGGGAPATQSQSNQPSTPPTAPVVVPHYAYVANSTDNQVSIYTVDKTTGALTSNGQVTVTPETLPQQIAFDPFYRFAYVANYGSNHLSVYSVNTASGALTPLGTVSTGSNPIGVAADPSGRFVYVANQNGKTVSQFSLNGVTGALTPIGPDVPAGNEPFSVAVDPSGQFVYVSSGPVSLPSPPTNDIFIFQIQPDGALLSLGPPEPVPAIPVDLTIHPNGKFLYVASGISHSVTAFKIKPDGTLSLTNTKDTGGTAARAVAVEKTGRFAYVVDTGTNEVSIFSIDPATGALSAATPPVVSPFLLPGTGARFLAVDPSGGFLYVTYTNSPFVSELSIDQVTGALKHLGTVPNPVGSVGITVIGTP